MKRFVGTCLGAIFLSSAAATSIAGGPSYFPMKPDDSSLLVLDKQAFPSLHADGVTDDSAALQDAIDQAASHRLVLLVPQGRYAITRTIAVPPSTRLIGFGAHRPVFILPPRTPGYQSDAPKYMVWFSGGRTRNPSLRPVTKPTAGKGGAVGAAFPDASPGTFYSGLINIDFEIQPGNPAAAAIRCHFAQHGIIAHCDFELGDGYAGLDAVGNEAEDLHFHGGQYGIVTAGTSPSWQYTLLDSSFDHQRVAAFKTHNTGLTLIRDSFHDLPTAIAIDDGQIERLWMKSCSLDHISGPAIGIGSEGNVRNQIDVENLFCTQVPVIAEYGPSGRTIYSHAGGAFVVQQFTYGLQIPTIGDRGSITDTYTEQPLQHPPALPESDIPALPPMARWVNVRSFGATGDGAADDLPAFTAAINSSHVVFVPGGRYRFSDSLRLQANTVLIGLNPITTQLCINDADPHFTGPGAIKGIIESAPGGTNIVQGLGVDSGANNPRAAGIRWTAGEHSMINDVKFLGGHGTWYPGGPRIGIYNADHSADPNPARKWNSSGPALLVTDNGGGTFANIWTASTFSTSGMTVENTTTPGRIYELSSEHHVRNEVIFRNVANWEIAAQQTEEEWGESPQCLPLEIDNCHHLTFANTILFRVFGMAAPFPTGIAVLNSHDLRFLGLHTYGQSPFNFDNSLTDVSSGRTVPSREAALVTIPPENTLPSAAPPFALAQEGASLEKIGDGYFSADHAIADAAGNAYFVDQHENKIYGYFAGDQKIHLLRNDPIRPFALAIDHSRNLLILSRLGKVFSVPLDHPDAPLSELAAVSAAPRPQMAAFLPVDRWWDWPYFLETNSRREPLDFVSPDKSVFIPVPNDYHTGQQRNWTHQPIDLYRGNQIAEAIPGRPFYVADEYAHQTWSFTATSDGTLRDPHLFAQRGEAGLTTDSAGNVFIAEGDIFAYDAHGTLLDVLHTPERALSLVFAGKDRRTLLITTRHAVFTLQMQAKG
ncbi:MAG: glycosyl hydrolase family 28-related protein [Phycisphaerae bacterium]